MATSRSKASVPPTETSLTATPLNSIGNGSTTATAITYDNTPTGTADSYPATLGDFNALIRVRLGSLTPAAGGYITLIGYLAIGANVEDFGGTPDINLRKDMTTTTGVKDYIFPVRLLPCGYRYFVKNNSGVAFAASGNGFFVQPFGDAHTSS